MKYRKSLIFNVIITVLSLGFFYLPNLSPTVWPMGTLLAQAIPLFLLMNVFFIIYWFFKKPMYMLLSLLIITIGFKYLNGLYALNFSAPEASGDLKVLSYNVRVFNAYDYLRVRNPNSSKEMIKWVAEEESDIKCLQEFYHEKTAGFNSLDKIKKNTRYYHLVPIQPHGRGQFFGMIILSKYPIIGKGNVFFKKNSNNQIIYADIKLKDDTIRIYNIHLQSMNMQADEIMGNKNDGWGEGRQKKLKAAILKYIRGAKQRSTQVQELIKHMEACPYKIIVCGDFNDPPISYSYQQVRKLLNNSFEEAGKGFGFTYNGELPIRIDNQFADKRLEVTSFKVHRAIKYSDHFPLSATYSFE